MSYPDIVKVPLDLGTVKVCCDSVCFIVFVLSFSIHGSVIGQLFAAFLLYICRNNTFDVSFLYFLFVFRVYFGRLLERQYATVEAFVRDVQLVFDNMRLFFTGDLEVQVSFREHSCCSQI